MSASRAASSRGGQRRQGASRGNGDAAACMSRVLRWYAGGVASGVFLSFMFYLVTLPPSDPADSTPGGTDMPAVTRDEPQPRFDFFEMLPQQRIEVEVEAGAMPRSREDPDGATYLLQAGSFRQAE